MADAAALAAQPAVVLPAFPGALVVTLRDCAVVGIAAGRGRRGLLQEAAAARWGVALPEAPHRVAADGVAFVWAGPETWLAVADGLDDGLMAVCVDAFGAHGAVVELGDGRCVLRLSGSGVRRALAGLLPIDLHPRAFGPGDTALTLAGHVHVQVWQLDDAPSYEVVVARSFAGSLVHHLQGIAAAL